MLSDAFLARLDTLRLAVRGRAAGGAGGSRRSRQTGSSAEFSDYREYIPGDDIRRIDWNAMARFDKVFLKLFMEEQESAVTVLLAAAFLTLFYVLIVAIYGQVYPAELAVNYLGFILQGCAFVAMDLFLSGCAATPVTAAVLAFGANFLMWILDLLENAVQAEWLSEAMRFLSLYRRNEPFMMGQLSFAGILFDLSFIAAFLALTVWHLDRKRYGK